MGKDIVSSNDTDHVFWTWRLYKRVEGCDWPVPDKEEVLKLMAKISSEIPELWLGMRAKWQAGGMVYVKRGRIIDLSDGSSEEKTGSGNKDLT